MITILSSIRRKKNIDSINISKHEYRVQLTVYDTQSCFNKDEIRECLPEFVNKLALEHENISFEGYNFTFFENLELNIYISKKELLDNRTKKEITNQIKHSFYLLVDYIKAERMRKKVENLEVHLVEKLDQVTKYEKQLSTMLTEYDTENLELATVQMESTVEKVIEKVEKHENDLADFMTQKEFQRYSSELEQMKQSVEQLKNEKEELSSLVTQQELSDRLGKHENDLADFMTQKEFQKYGSELKQVKQSVEQLKNEKEELSSLVTQQELSVRLEKYATNLVTQQEWKDKDLRIKKTEQSLKELEKRLTGRMEKYEEQASNLVTQQEFKKHETVATEVKQSVERIEEKVEKEIPEKLEQYQLMIKELEQLKQKIVKRIELCEAQLVDNFVQPKIDNTDIQPAELQKQHIKDEITTENEHISEMTKETVKQSDLNLKSDKTEHIKEVVQMSASDISAQLTKIYEMFMSEKHIIKIRDTFMKNEQAQSYSNQLNYCVFYWQYLKKYDFLIAEKEIQEYIKSKLEELPVFIETFDYKVTDKVFIKLSFLERKELLAYIELKKLLEKYYLLISK